MLNKWILSIFLQDPFQDKVQVEEGRCLRRQPLKNKCEKCYEQCPEHAITRTDTSIAIDALSCTGCGVCVSSCYSLAIGLEEDPYKKAVQSIEQNESLSWACMKSTENADINWGCIRAIDSRFLIALGLQKEIAPIQMDLTECHQCAYRELGVPLEKVCADLNHYNGRVFHFVYSHAKKEISRRDFFRGIGIGGKELKESASKQVKKSLGTTSTEITKIDTLTDQLLSKISTNEIPSEMIMKYIYNVEITTDCTFCYRCVKACPYNALSIKRDLDEISIQIDPKKCTFCNLCVDICPEKACKKVNYDSDKNPKTLILRKTARCKDCRIQVPILSEDGRCPSCEIREKNRRNRLNKKGGKNV